MRAKTVLSILGSRPSRAPSRATRGVEGGYQLAAGACLPPMALDDEVQARVVNCAPSSTREKAPGQPEPRPGGLPERASGSLRSAPTAAC